MWYDSLYRSNAHHLCCLGHSDIPFFVVIHDKGMYVCDSVGFTSFNVIINYRSCQNMKELFYFDWDVYQIGRLKAQVNELYYWTQKEITYFVHTGTIFILPCIDKYQTVDLRTKSFDVPPQNVCKSVI